MIQKCKAYKKYTFQGHVNKFKERMEGPWYEMSYEGASLSRNLARREKWENIIQKTRNKYERHRSERKQHIQGTASVFIFIFSGAEG